MENIFILCICASLTLCQGTPGTVSFDINIDTDKALSVTEDEYLSFTLDFFLKSDPNNPWPGLNFTHPRFQTLVKGLAPATLRFGGTRADWSIFYNVTSADEQKRINDINRVAKDKGERFFLIAIFPQDIDALVSVARMAGGRLLYDLSIELRWGPQWDSTNARLLMKYIIEKGYSSYVDFEMGNEPPYNQLTKAAFNATGERIAKDFQILRNVMDQFPEFKNSRLVGPDVETPRDGTYSGQQAKIMHDFVQHAKSNIDAVTAHHYYFNGAHGKIGQFYDLKYFKLLESTLPLLRKTVEDAAGGSIDIWIGETADSNVGGTPGLTDRFASGFLWLDKLGIAARNGIKLVARQDLFGNHYGLISDQLMPNPDYWLSHVFKKLVGRPVLNATVIVKDKSSPYASSSPLLRCYAHCTSQRSRYSSGSVVLIAINLDTNNSAHLDLNLTDKNADIDVYIMTPENGTVTSRNSQLNGHTLTLIDDYTLPAIRPKSVKPDDIIFPPLSYGFVVVKHEHFMMADNICVGMK